MRENDAILQLRRYNSTKASVINLQQQIDMLNDAMTTIKSSLGGDGSHGGSPDNKLDSIIDKKDKLKAEMDIRQRQVDIIERSLESLGEDDRNIVKRFYTDGINANRVNAMLQDELMIDERTIWRMKRNAIDHYLYAVGTIE